MIIKSPIGNIEINCDDTAVYRIDLYCRDDLKPPSTFFEERVVKELDDYFRGRLIRFTLPICLSESDYRNRVCQALKDIPFGETATYGQLAKTLSSVPRAIGGACRHNPLPIILPCHRVVAKQGIGGFSGAISGAKIDIKRWLLNHEQSVLAANG